MDITIRTVAPEEFDDFVRAQHRTFGHHPKDEDVAVERLIAEPGRTLAAFDGDAVVGGTMAVTFRMTVPGGETLATAGITSVGVQPTHRRRGLLTNLMQEQLEDLHRRGEPLAALWASEAGIYGRFGYGDAAPILDLRIDRAYTRFAVPVEPPRSVRLVEKEEALRVFPSVYERFLPGRPGTIARSEAWWAYGLSDLEHHRDGAGPRFHAVLEGETGPEGYATYRLRHDWQQNLPATQMEIEDLIGVTPLAQAQLWRFCMDVDLVASIRAWLRPPDEAVRNLLADPRRLDMRVLDGLYVRTVDVPAALAGRRYATEGRLVLEVADRSCPWNAGRFALEGGPDGADCVPTRDAPDLRLDATALGAAYLGGVRFSALAGALMVLGEPEAIDRADRMFASNVAPWCPLHF